MLKRLGKMLPHALGKRGPVVPVVPLSGPIGAGAPFRRPLTLAGVAGALDRAFALERAPSVALLINSPGGAPVQSHLIFQRIRALAAERDRHVIAFIEDMATSGGYMIACAGDEIVADPGSIVGSIGVVSQGFGFSELIGRIGIERRVHAAGGDKALLDPFLPEKPRDVAHLTAIQEELHAHFIDVVRARRGARLEERADLFSGLFWAGGTARTLGLVDDIGEPRGVLRARYGEGVRLRVIQPGTRSLLRRLFAATGTEAPDAGPAAAAGWPPWAPRM